MAYVQAYEYGYGHDGAPLYGYSNSTFDPTDSYTHTHSYYADAYGTYERSFDEERGPAFDRTYQSTQTYADGVYRSDVLSTTTPLDGSYHSYGTRYTSTYNIYNHTATTNYVVFYDGYSSSTFDSNDYQTGASVSSHDVRYFYSYGYYEYTSSTYSGPGGSTTTAGGMYHYS